MSVAADARGPRSWAGLGDQLIAVGRFTWRDPAGGTRRYQISRNRAKIDRDFCGREQVDMDAEPETAVSHVAAAASFYGQLFRALEFGTSKAESQLEEALFQEFGVTDQDDPLEWLSENREPEEVFGWLLGELAPFAQMLLDIYQRLQGLRATMGGNVREVSFDFERLRERVSFALDSFPKLYVQRWASDRSVVTGFEPSARGHLRIDTPDYWADDVPALSNLSNSEVLGPHVFDGLPLPNQRAVIDGVNDVMSALQENYIRKSKTETPAGWPFGNQRIVYLADETDWNQALQRGLQSDADLFDYRRVVRGSGRVVYADWFEDLLGYVGPQRTAALGGVVGEPALASDLESDDTHAFLSALRLCLPDVERETQRFVDVVDRVLLPFWRHRWRLVEVWSMLWTIDTIPEAYRPVPVLAARDDSPGTFSWILPGGEATYPVGVTKGARRALSVWFQLATPLSADDAAHYKQAHIEPDVRVRYDEPPRRGDVVIVELKDRYLAAGSAEKRVARMYATTRAKVVCVANYSPFRSRSLRGSLYTESIGESTIYLVDGFKPGSVPHELTEAIRHAIAGDPIDVLVDVSASMDRGRLAEALGKLPSTPESRWFRWAANFEEAEDRQAAAGQLHGLTDLRQAVTAYEKLRTALAAIIVTDDDGQTQFESLADEGFIDRSRYICVNVTRQYPAQDLEAWIDARAAV
jgi:hypothetical protein